MVGWLWRSLLLEAIINKEWMLGKGPTCVNFVDECFREETDWKYKDLLGRNEFSNLKVQN